MFKDLIFYKLFVYVLCVRCEYVEELLRRVFSARLKD